MMKPSLWSPLVRVPAFAVLFLVGYRLSYFFPVLSTKSDLATVFNVFREIGAGEFRNVGHPEFAFALACAIVSSAAGLALAILVMHVFAIRLALRSALKALGPKRDPRAFRGEFQTADQRLSNHPLVGHAWSEFAKTCVKEDVVVRTVRPGSLISASAARENLAGLKLMPTIPGYFVGLGLLLTFVGLVIALSKAAGGVAGSPENMTQSLRELLDAATFKFATSIAGLFASLALALTFKVYSIAIETGFERFARAIEARTTFQAPQEALQRLQRTSDDQLNQLKAINDVQFFTRLGSTIAPALADAVEKAVKPLAAQLEATANKLDDNSRTGAEGLITQFTKTIQGSAGAEISALAGVLRETKEALEGVRGNLAGSSEDFARKIAAATEGFSRLVGQAGDQFNNANSASRETMEGLLAALREAGEQARDRMNSGVSEAGKKAATMLETGLGEVLSRVEKQMGSFQTVLAGFQERVTEESGRSAAASKDAARAAATAAGEAAREAAASIRSGFNEVVTELRGDMERMSAAMRASAAAFAEQARAHQQTTEQSTVVATAFGKVANDVSSASRPLVQSADRITASTETMARAVTEASAAIRVGQDAAKTLADRLEANQRQVEAAWKSYDERFGAVDQVLADAVKALAAETTRQQQGIAQFVRDIDAGCADAIQKLHTVTSSLEQNTTDLADTFEDFLTNVRRVPANA